MTTTNAYPKNFKYKQSHFEGTHTSYSWQQSHPDDEIIAETKQYYKVWFHDCKKPRNVKKESIKF